MSIQEEQDSTDTMVLSLEKIANRLQRLLIVMYACSGLLGFILFLILLRLMIGR
jgi:hypothetical protein